MNYNEPHPQITITESLHVTITLVTLQTFSHLPAPVSFLAPKDFRLILGIFDSRVFLFHGMSECRIFPLSLSNIFGGRMSEKSLFRPSPDDEPMANGSTISREKKLDSKRVVIKRIVKRRLPKTQRFYDKWVGRIAGISSLTVMANGRTLFP